MPEQDTVVAITAGTSQIRDIFDLVWDRLAPAMQDGPLDDNPAEVERLREQLGNLSIRVPAAHAAAEGEPVMDGHSQWLGRSWQFEDNDLDIDALALENRDDQTIVVIATPTGDHEIAIGNGGPGPQAVPACFRVPSVCCWATIRERVTAWRLPEPGPARTSSHFALPIRILHGSPPSRCSSAKRASPSTLINVADLHQEFRR